MRQCEFKNFKQYLVEDTEEAECLGWAFLQLTEKQVKEVIKMYDEKGLVKREGNVIKFGTNYQWIWRGNV